MNILIIGSGGREHALGWKLAQSPKVAKIFVAPGNGGTNNPEQKLHNIAIDVMAFEELVQFAITNRVNLVVPGPEQPLVEGIKEVFTKVGIPCFGPSQLAARLEGSKAFSKDFMSKYNVPTASYRNFTNYEAAKEYLDNVDYSVVIKASGLAAGKGVLIPQSKEEAHQGLYEMMVDQKFGASGSEVVIEEFMDGEELSILALCDGYTALPLLPAQDHKRAYDGDLGPNTGGMGCYCPTPLTNPKLMQDVHKLVLEPTLRGMRREGAPFIGCLFVGIMITKKDNQIKVLEYNVRFGDPETEVTLPLLKSDLFEIMLSCVEGRLDVFDELEFHNGLHAATVILASEGYPGPIKKDRSLILPSQNNQDKVTIFHAGTKINSNDELVSSGGRVLSVTGVGSDLTLALENSYATLNQIQLEGSFYRKDIGHRALKYQQRQPNSLTYSQAGVDIDAGNELVNRIKKVVKSTQRPGCDAELGGFGGLFDLKAANYVDPVLVSATDGVGTKLLIAHQTNNHTTIGIDLVAMSVNDLIVQGAEPLFFLDYFACGKLNVSVTADVVSGVAEGCLLSKCALIGGETAEMPGLYAPGEYDLGGFAVGAVERANILPKHELFKAGDALIGLSSSGPHSNGYSLLRKISELANLSFDSQCPVSNVPNQTLGQTLLTPTTLYIQPLLPLIQKQLIKGMAHITGGGFQENLPRVLPAHLNAKVDVKSWVIPPIFKWAQSVGNVDPYEMARTFNCGLGMILVVDQTQVEHVLTLLKEWESVTKPYIIGELIDNNNMGDEHDRVKLINLAEAWQ